MMSRVGGGGKERSQTGAWRAWWRDIVLLRLVSGPFWSKSAATMPRLVPMPAVSSRAARRTEREEARLHHSPSANNNSKVRHPSLARPPHRPLFPPSLCPNLSPQRSRLFVCPRSLLSATRKRSI
ncbi:hypothetical protein FKP32DRAFT_513049 [Trametes sanguinea]|nr:hypothetical protein FKP32DRAFT_513049 [Trametes sanguinea]